MYIADLHIHSKYSRATSKEGVPEVLEFWAKRKGIGLLGTGDFTHPAWRAELREKLVPAEEGFFTLKDSLSFKEDVPADREAGAVIRPRFVISGEISSIYKKNGKVRKVHNLILLPSLEAADALSKRLEAIGNVHSDGRPILGLDSRDLLEITLECCRDAEFIPAHIWTPHFSLFGAFSGFDTIEECFEDLTPYIHALETGLSSDPPMNWRLSALDRYTLVSNSDAHSPGKLGREANLFHTELSYPAMRQALEQRGGPGFGGTIEFFPEEGKYHFDGHRNCKQCLAPAAAERVKGICPVCGKKLTIGVLHRVEQLADRPEGFIPRNAPRFESLVPLPEVIAASTGCSPASVRVAAQYETMLRKLGSEFYILREASLEAIEKEAGPCVAEGVRRARNGRIHVSPGFDGEYGKIHILDEKEIGILSGQLSLFGGTLSEDLRTEETAKPAEGMPMVAVEPDGQTSWMSVTETGRENSASEQSGAPFQKGIAALLDALNDAQQEAVTAEESAVAVVAGPGTGKTKTLISRMEWLVKAREIKPEEITAVTFTNQAAGELRERLAAALGSQQAAKAFRIGTFHGICLGLLTERRGGITVIDQYEAEAVAGEVIGELALKCGPRRLLREISAVKNGSFSETGAVKRNADSLDGFSEAYALYQDKLKRSDVLDFDDLLLEALAEETVRFPYLLVDEFQDVNSMQYRLMELWSRGGGHVFIIGDPDQSIYGFRGADAHCFERFMEERPAARRISLVNNYRSTPEILGCALPVISQNPGMAGGRALRAQRESGDSVALLRAPDEFTEAIFVAKEINRMVGGIDLLDIESLGDRRGSGEVRGFSDIAVLYRTHRQAEVLEHCLRKESIPYVVSGRDKLLSDPIVRGTAGFFRFLFNPGDSVSLRTFLRLGLGCQEEAVKALLALLEQKRWPKSIKTLAERLPQMLPDSLLEIPEIGVWMSLTRAYGPRLKKETPQKLLEAWAEDRGIAGESAMERLILMAVLQKDMASLLQTLTLGEERDVTRCGGRQYTADAVSLMTFHGAKGLEFPVVFLCGARRGILPLERPGHGGTFHRADAELEEERRLLYVGMTRAKEELLMLWSGEKSPFLENLPNALLDIGETAAGKKAPAEKQLSFF